MSMTVRKMMRVRIGARDCEAGQVRRERVKRTKARKKRIHLSSHKRRGQHGPIRTTLLWRYPWQETSVGGSYATLSQRMLLAGESMNDDCDDSSKISTLPQTGLLLHGRSCILPRRSGDGRQHPLHLNLTTKTRFRTC